MKSKTSCFNFTIFKKNITHFWPIWMAYLAYLLLSEPVVIWQMGTREWYWENYTIEERMYEVIGGALDMMVSPYMTFIFAAVMALAVFSYLYSAKNANMIHALPVNRLELFVTNYLSGLTFLLIPQIIAFFVSVLVCMGNQVTCMQYLLFGLLCQMGTAFFAYSLAVFVAMFTGQMLAMPIYYLVVNYLYIGCCYIVNILIELLCYGVAGRWNPGKTAMLSPLYYLGDNLWVYRLYDQKTGVQEGIEFVGIKLVAVYALVAIFITIAAYRIYRRRHIETAGDWISEAFVKPVFRWGCGLCGGILLSLIVVYSVKDNVHMNVYAGTVVSAAVMGFICFFVAEMLICKQFRVFKKKRLMEWGVFTIVMVSFITLFKVDAFGIERYVPDIDEIEVAYVNMDYPVLVEGEDLAELVDIHKDVIAHRDEYLAIEQENHGYYYTTFRYRLKDGTTFERRYPVAITEEYTNSADSPVSRILAWEREPENLKENIFGTGYEKYEYTGGYIDVYNENLDYNEQTFDEAGAEVLIEAIMKDIEAGNYDAYYASCDGKSYDIWYYNNIYLDFYNRSGNSRISDYYSDYAKGTTYESVEIATESGYNNSCIMFGENCVNTVRAIKELGLVDDTWKLYTQEEYDEYQGID